MNKTYFRYIVAAGLILSVISMSIPFLANILPDGLISYTEYRNTQSFYWPDYTWLYLVIFCIFLVSIIANITLFFFKSWARPTFTITIIISYLMTLFYGAQAYFALETTLDSVITLIDGAIIALLYFSPISKEFSSSTKQPTFDTSASSDSLENKNKNYKNALMITAAGVLVVSVGYGLIAHFKTTNEQTNKIISEHDSTPDSVPAPVSDSAPASESDVVGAQALLKRFGLEISEEPISTPLASSLLTKVKEYRINYDRLSEDEQIDKWLALLELSLKVEKGDKQEQYENFDSYTRSGVGVKSAMMVIPNTDKWHLLNNDNVPKSTDVLQTQAAQYLFSNLNVDDEAIKDLLEKLEITINELEGGNKSARLRTFYKIQTTHILSGGESDKILNVLNKQLGIDRQSNEVIKVPNLLKIVGKENTIQWLKQALIVDKVILDILKGTETYTLARNLALELSSELKTPQWKLAQELNSNELYEKLDKKFSAPDQNDYNLSRDYENAFAYYFISHVVNNDVERSLDIIKNSYSKNDFKITKDIFYELEKNGYSEQVWNVLDALLTDNSALPLWGSYFKVSATLDKTEFALNKISSLLENDSFSAKNKTSLQQYYINGLLSVGDTSKAIPLMRENIEALSSGKKRTKAAIKLAKIARLLGNSDDLEYALPFVVAGLQQKPKESMVDYLADIDYFGYEERELIGFLREIDSHIIPQRYLISGIDKQIKKVENVPSEHALLYTHTIKPYAIELMGIYYDLAQWEDIKLFIDNFPYWGVEDIATIINEKDSREIPLGMMLAKALVETGDTDSATRILKKVIRNNAGYDPAYKLYMDINGDESIKYFESVYKLDQFEERPLIWQAQAYLNSGHYQLAKKVVKKAISIDPSDGEQGVGDRMRAYSILENVLEQEGNVNNSNFYRNAIKAIRLSEHADRYNELGLYSIAIDKYSEAAELFTYAYCIQSRLAIQLTSQGQHKAAAQHYKKAFELMPDSFGRIESHCFGCENIFDHPNARTLAESVFEKIIKKRPRNAQAHYMLGYLRKEQRRYDEAIESFRKAVALDPKYLNAWKKLYEIGQKSYLPGWENDIALLKMFKLDPLQRHTHLNFAKVTDLKKLWHTAEKAYKNAKNPMSSIYTLGASKKKLSETTEEQEPEINRYYPYSYSEGSEPLPPAALLMKTNIVSGAMELIMEPVSDDMSLRHIPN